MGAPFILKLRTMNKRMIMTMMRSTHLHIIRKRVVRKNKFKQARITFSRKIKFLKRLSKQFWSLQWTKRMMIKWIRTLKKMTRKTYNSKTAPEMFGTRASASNSVRKPTRKRSKNTSRTNVPITA